MGFHKSTDDFDEFEETPKKTKHFNKIRNSIQSRKDSINQFKNDNVKMQNYLKEHPEKINEVTSFNSKEMLKTVLFIGIYMGILALTIKLSDYYTIMKIASVGLIALGGIAVIFYTIGKKYLKK